MLNYNSLYLTSGGTNGYSLLGSTYVLEKLKLINNYKRIIGTSIGSLIGFLITLKYTSLEIFSALKSQNIENIYFNHTFKQENVILNLIHNLGLNNANGINRILELFLKEKNLNITITFKELYEFNNIELIIVSSNLTINDLKYFSYKNTPNCPICMAIKSSCAIPVLFNPIIYENNILVDGGFFEFKKNKYVNNKTLTIRIRNIDISTKLDKSNLDISTYISYLMEYLIKNTQKIYDNKVHTIFLNFNKTGINFNVSNKDKLEMFEYGIINAISFIKNKNIKNKYFYFWKNFKTN